MTSAGEQREPPPAPPADAPLVPVRTVDERVCRPRPACLMRADGAWADTADAADGRRRDQADGPATPAADDRKGAA